MWRLVFVEGESPDEPFNSSLGWKVVSYQCYKKKTDSVNLCIKTYRTAEFTAIAPVKTNRKNVCHWLHSAHNPAHSSPNLLDIQALRSPVGLIEPSNDLASSAQPISPDTAMKEPLLEGSLPSDVQKAAPASDETVPEAGQQPSQAAEARPDSDKAIGEEMDSRRRVVIAVDESDESMSALSWALDNIVKRDTDKVHLLHVQPEPHSYAGPVGAGLYIAPDVLESVRKYNVTRSRVVLQAGLDQCQLREVAAEGDVIVGEAREAICAAVEQIHGDLLVLGSHGYGAFKRALLGSVSEYCVRHATCPVVVVKKQKQ